MLLSAVAIAREGNDVSDRAGPYADALANDLLPTLLPVRTSS